MSMGVVKCGEQQVAICAMQVITGLLAVEAAVRAGVLADAPLTQFRERYGDLISQDLKFKGGGLPKLLRRVARDLEALAFEAEGKAS